MASILHQLVSDLEILCSGPNGCTWSDIFLRRKNNVRASHEHKSAPMLFQDFKKAKASL